MSQIFIERTLTGLGLAVVSKDYKSEKLTLLDLYPAADDSLDDFPESLQALIQKHGVTEIQVSKMAEGEGYVSDIPELQGIPAKIEIREMRKTVKPLSGRIVRATMLKAEKLDETTEYKQSEKLSERISRIDKAQTAPLDISAYLSAVVLAEGQCPEEITDENLGTFGKDYNDFI